MRKPALHFLIALLAASCAQILTPGGGPKDHTPPRVVRYQPDSAATNFTGKRIVIRFDEYVQLKDLNNQLIVSPPLNEPPEVNIRKKEIVIDFSDTLLPNTTYSISFGNAISDITENNVLDNFRYVFSTGPVIDSIRFSGRVVNASTLAGEKGVFVMFYEHTGDSVPYKERPYYFTKTKEDGSFTLTNIRAGRYKVFALDDKNQDYRYDNSEERIAFTEGTVDLTHNIDTLNMRLFHEEPSTQSRMKVSQNAPGHITLAWALPLKNPQVKFTPEIPAAMNPFIEKSVTGDSLDIWFGTVSLDSVRIVVSDGNGLSDSSTVRLTKEEKIKRTPRGPGMSARKMQLGTNAQNGQLFAAGKPLIINCNNPVREWKVSDLVLLRGKDTVRADVSLSENRHYLIFHNTLDEDSSYTLFVRPGVITDWFGQKNDTLKTGFKVQSPSSYGKLTVKPTGITSGHYLLQIVNDKDQLIREMKITESGAVDFEKLPGGNYRIRLVNDENNNGKWDSGNYLQHRQPERVIYYAKNVKMRAGWDMEVEWVFN
jgi:hypothetical protein